MANYNNLKETIDDNIYENGQQEITGPILNSTLNAMVTALGKGYLFGGMVYPTTAFTPGDENIAFLASQTGSYPAFNNFTVEAGEVALFIWNGTWRKQIISYYSNTDVYGVRHFYNNSSPDLTRIGSSSMHRDLPVQSLMRRCVVDDMGNVVYYLSATDSTKRATGESAVLDGSAGQVMVEVPAHYRKTTLNEVGGYVDTEISLYPFDGSVFVPRYLVSAYEAALDRTNNKLSSVMNTSAQYRGGNNNADWDGTYRSLLGLPATSISLTNFRTSAQNRGTGWGCYDWNIHCDIFWLFAIEYATLNTQKEFNPDLTSQGYHQGGLGSGVSKFTNWGTYNSYNPIIPCGFTNSLGNATGVKTFTLTTEQAEAYGSEHSESVPSYRGIENPFGHINKWADGCLAKGNGTTQDYYVCRNRSQYASALSDNYTKIGTSVGARGHVKNILASVLSMLQTHRNYGDLLASNVEGSSSTYFCDYAYEAHADGTIYGAYVGGYAYNGCDDGFACVYSNATPSYSSAALGSRLSWVKQE